MTARHEIPGTYYMCVADRDEDGEPLAYALRIEVTLCDRAPMGVIGPSIPAIIAQGMGELSWSGLFTVLYPLFEEGREMMQFMIDQVAKAAQAFLVSQEEGG